MSSNLLAKVVNLFRCKREAKVIAPDKTGYRIGEVRRVFITGSSQPGETKYYDEDDSA